MKKYNFHYLFYFLKIDIFKISNRQTDIVERELKQDKKSIRYDSI